MDSFTEERSLSTFLSAVEIPSLIFLPTSEPLTLVVCSSFDLSSLALASALERPSMALVPSLLKLISSIFLREDSNSLASLFALLIPRRSPLKLSELAFLPRPDRVLSTSFSRLLAFSSSERPLTLTLALSVVSFAT